jgi:uncharacterized membrane protein
MVENPYAAPVDCSPAGERRSYRGKSALTPWAAAAITLPLSVSLVLFAWGGVFIRQFFQPPIIGFVFTLTLWSAFLALMTHPRYRRIARCSFWLRTFLFALQAASIICLLVIVCAIVTEGLDSLPIVGWAILVLAWTGGAGGVTALVLQGLALHRRRLRQNVAAKRRVYQSAATR